MPVIRENPSKSIVATLLAAVMLLMSGCNPGQPPATATPTIQADGATIIIPTLQSSATTSTEIPQDEAAGPSVVSPTAAAMTSSGELATAVPPPTETATPFMETPPPTTNPRAVSTLKPRPAVMKISRPGPYSKLSSPIRLEALITPGEDGLVYVNLYGENGRLIVSQILDFRGYDTRSFYISPEIPFQINSAAELSRITVHVNDQFGQMIHLISVDVILLQYGSSDETIPEIELEPYLVRSPGEGALIRGGVLVVEGSARPVTDSPLMVELVDMQGNVVGSGETQLLPPSESSSHMPFQVIVPYSVTGRTRVRMTLKQESTTRIPGTVWLSSSVIFLDP